MRKHSVRKWIHAILDMLPLVIIPIFAIYSHRHNIDNYSVTVQENTYQDYNFNQYVLNGKPYDDDFNGWYKDSGIDLAVGSNNGVSYIYAEVEEADETIAFCSLGGNYIDNICYITFDARVEDVGAHCYIDINDSEDSLYNFDINNNDFVKYDFISAVFINNNLGFSFTFSNPNMDTFVDIKNVQLFDLTSIFGDNNEPSLSECRDIFVQDYYDYGVTYTYSKYLGVVDVTYDDTDIGSQFMYQMYNVTDKYFNFNKVGNFNDIYNWFETNLFGGNAPLSFFIVWNIILYELIMDIIFLAYMVFMFIVDVAENMIDSFCERSRKGGR